MTPGHFKLEADDSRTVVADFYCYLCCVDVVHKPQDGGIVIFHFSCNIIRDVHGKKLALGLTFVVHLTITNTPHNY